MRRTYRRLLLVSLVVPILAVSWINYANIRDFVLTTREPFLLSDNSGRVAWLGYETRHRWTKVPLERVAFHADSGVLWFRKRVGPWSEAIDDPINAAVPAVFGSVNCTFWNRDGTIRVQAVHNPEKWREPNGFSPRRQAPWLWGERDYPKLTLPGWLKTWSMRQS